MWKYTYWNGGSNVSNWIGFQPKLTAGLGIDITNDTVTSTGNKNKNTASGADAVKYDWVGTTAEYTTQNIETLHPDWICYITDDQGIGVGAVYNANQADARFFKKNDNTDSTTISGLSMPSDRYETVTLLSTGNTYTAPANGMFVLKGKANSTSTGPAATITSSNGIYCSSIRITSVMGGKIYYLTHWVKAGEVITISWDSSALVLADSLLSFVYAEGNPTNP